MTSCLYRTPQEICYAVQKARDDLKLTPRPWNMHDPNASPWWLVPSTEWPACKYNKLYFGRFGENQLLLGYHVEKGLGASVKAAYPKAKGVFMADDWQWLTFLHALEKQTLQSQLLSTAAELSLPIVLRVSGFFVQDPNGYDPYSPLRKPDVFTWELNGSTGTLATKSIEHHVYAIPQLELASVSDLSREITKLTVNPWLWVDVHIGLAFEIATDPPPGSVWDAARMWRDFLEPFRGTLLLV